VAKTLCTKTLNSLRNNTVLLEGIVGEGVELNVAALDATRPSELSFHWLSICSTRGSVIRA
jgi:hypothetical protein